MKYFTKTSMIIMVMLTMTVGATEAIAQQTNEGEIHFDVYVGGPNLLKSVLKSTYANSIDDEKIEFSGVPTLGVRASYMVSDMASVGIDVNYSNTIIKFPEGGLNVLTEDGIEGVTTLTVPRIKAMVRFELHFGDSDDFDIYWPIAAGWRKVSYDFTSTDPDFVQESVNFGFPLAFRTGVGGRYFFTDNIGANLEIGLGGGPIIEFGLAVKI